MEHLIKKCQRCGNIWAGNWYNPCPKCGDSGCYDEPDTPIEDLENAANEGNAQAQFELGVRYMDGIPRDYTIGDPRGVIFDCYATEESVELFLKAAEQGHAGAQYELGKAYCDDWMGTYNQATQDAEAFKWFSKAAEQGHVAAQVELGKCYKEGRGVERNYEEAVKWFRKAADADFTEAQCELGKCYKAGLGVEQSYEEAVKWYRKAAMYIDSNANYLLGMCYLEGKGVRKNPYAAFFRFKSNTYHYEEADAALEELCQSGCLEEFDIYQDEFEDMLEGAECGDADSQYELGEWYEFGDFDEPIDLDEAAYWYGKAAEQGHEEAKEALRRLEK